MIHHRAVHAALLTTAALLTLATPARAQQQRAPLRLAVVSLDPAVAGEVGAFEAVLAQSPNVARRPAQALATPARTAATRALAMCRDGAEVALTLAPARDPRTVALLAYGSDGELALRVERSRPLDDATAREVLGRVFAATARQVLRLRADDPSRCARLLAAATTDPTAAKTSPGDSTTTPAARPGAQANQTPAPRVPHKHPWRWIELHSGSIIRLADDVEGDGPVFTGPWVRLRMGEPLDGFAVRREIGGAYLPISWGSGGHAWRFEALVGPSWSLGKRWTLELLGAFQGTRIKADTTPRGFSRDASFMSLMGVGRASVWLGNRVELRMRIGSGGNILHREYEQSAPRGQVVTSGFSVGVRVARVLIDLGTDVELLMYERFTSTPETFQQIRLGVGFLSW